MKSISVIKGKNDVISSMFFSAAVAMIFSQVAGVVANIIDGIVTSRFLGADALSSISLLGPFISTIILISGFVSTGSQVVCGNLVGEGKRKEANSVFSVAIIAILFASVIFLSLCVLFPDVIFRICGVTNTSHSMFRYGMGEYLKGYMIGIPAVMAIQILGPFIAMDNGKTHFTVSSVLLCVTDIIGDLLNAICIGGGVFGMGVATSISFYVQLIFLMAFYLKPNCYFRFSLSGVKSDGLCAISKEGLPTLVRKLATVLRDLFVSRINLSVAITGAAVAARAMQNDINTLMFCIGLGIGKTLLTVTGIYYSANDKQGLKRLFTYSIKMALMISGIFGLGLFIFARYIAGLYTADKEVLEFSVFSIRCMAVSLVMDTVLVSFQNYLQGIKNRLMVNLFNFGERFIIPVLIALTMGQMFGSKGVLASIAVGKVILFIAIYIIVWAYLKRPPCCIEDFMFLPSDFGGEEEDNLYVYLESMDDVAKQTKVAEEFCIEHGCDRATSKKVAFTLEEMAGNIIRHGRPNGRVSTSVDCRLYKDGEKIGLTLRDYCIKFDPTAFCKMHRDDKDEHIGIRAVNGIAKDISYFNAFNSNNLIIGF